MTYFPGSKGVDVAGGYYRLLAGVITVEWETGER